MRRLPPVVLLLALVAALLVGQPSAAAPAQGIPQDAFLSAMEGGNTAEAKIREPYARQDGFRHIDTPALIQRLKQLHMTMYTFGIWDKATDWDDLRTEFAPAAQRAGIDIMVYVVPPSECFLNPVRHLDGRCSRPFNLDFERWSSEIAKLSLRYPNVKSWGIDDFLVGQNAELFTEEYLGKVRAAQDAIKPDLKWYVTLYYYEINAANVAKIDDHLDGVIYPYTGYNNNTIDPTWLETRLDGARDVLQPAGLDLILLVYTGRFLDGMIHPDERYVGDVLRRATPYLSDGRIGGIIAYGAPVRADLQQPSWDFWGRSGLGRLSLSVGNFTSTVDGSYAAASQQVSVGSGSKALEFWHRDQDAGELRGYQTKQLLVDDQVVWESDTQDDPREEWIHTRVDLTEVLAGKTTAKLTFRLFHKIGVGWWPLDWSIDDVRATGFSLRNGGFEQNKDWELTRNQPTMQPYIELFAKDRPVRILNAIGAGFARYQGELFTPLRAQAFPDVRIGPDNRAMYGNGRLAFTVPGGALPANTCGTAAQTVRVRPGMSRYELSFWHADPVQARFGQVFKQIRIDGKMLWDRDGGDFWPWFYINASDHQGGIDITEFVTGKSSVQLEFRVCTKDAQTNAKATTIGFDHLEAIGLDIANPGFERVADWRLTSAAPITAAYDIAGR